MAVGNVLKGFVLLVVAGLSLGIARAYAANEVLAYCDDCQASQYQACAIQMGHQFDLSNASRVWVVDFVRQQVTKYELEVYPPGTIIYGSDSETSSGSTIIPIQVPLSPWEEDAVDQLVDWVNQVLRPNGGGYSFTQCTSSPTASNRERDDDASIRSGGAVAIQPIEVPPDAPWTSAYDIIGNTSASIQLASMLLSDMNIMNSLGVLYNLANNFINVLPVNLEAVIRMEFPDGSIGKWEYNAFAGRWEADFATFSDSDGNPIPMTPSDMTGRTYHFGGQPPGQDNLIRFLGRAQALGIPITGPGGGTLPTECEMVGDRLRCSPLSGY